MLEDAAFAHTFHAFYIITSDPYPIYSIDFVKGYYKDYKYQRDKFPLDFKVSLLQARMVQSILLFERKKNTFLCLSNADSTIN